MNEVNENALERAAAQEAREGTQAQLEDLRARLADFAENNSALAESIQASLEEDLARIEREFQATLAQLNGTLAKLSLGGKLEEGPGQTAATHDNLRRIEGDFRETIATYNEVLEGLENARPKTVEELEEKIGDRDVLLTYYTIFNVDKGKQAEFVNGLLKSDLPIYKRFMGMLKRIQEGEHFDLGEYEHKLEDGVTASIWKDGMEISDPVMGVVRLRRNPSSKHWLVDSYPQHPEHIDALVDQILSSKDPLGGGVPQILFESLKAKRGDTADTGMRRDGGIGVTDTGDTGGDTGQR